MPRRSPYAIGLDHGKRGLPRYSHRPNGRRYDSSNANATYEVGYGDGTNIRLAVRDLPLFRHAEHT